MSNFSIHSSHPYTSSDPQPVPKKVIETKVTSSSSDSKVDSKVKKKSSFQNSRPMFATTSTTLVMHPAGEVEDYY